MPPRDTIPVQIVGVIGHVWNVEDARRLRSDHRIHGDVVGGLSDFQNQNAVRGLPLELSPEEVTLALSQGWITLVQAAGEGGGREAKHGTGDAGAEGASSSSSPPWKELLQSKQHVTIPLHGGGGHSSMEAMSSSEWAKRYPANFQEEQRAAVFADLHGRGYTLTGASKFGGDFLLYPGEPASYHAQFVVQVVDWEGPIHPLMLAGSGRAAHAARKHMLVASLPARGEPVQYITCAPEGGFAGMGIN